jgi:hypothetical protein
MSFDPRRALVGLAMAGALVIAPPAIGYAMSGISPHANSVASRNDNRRSHVNDNADNDNFSSVSPGSDGAYVPPPPPGPSGPPTDDSAYNNSPNNQDSPGNGGNP